MLLSAIINHSLGPRVCCIQNIYYIYIFNLPRPKFETQNKLSFSCGRTVSENRLYYVAHVICPSMMLGYCILKCSKHQAHTTHTHTQSLFPNHKNPQFAWSLSWASLETILRHHKATATRPTDNIYFHVWCKLFVQHMLKCLYTYTNYIHNTHIDSLNNHSQPTAQRTIRRAKWRSKSNNCQSQSVMWRTISQCLHMRWTRFTACVVSPYSPPPPLASPPTSTFNVLLFCIDNRQQAIRNRTKKIDVRSQVISFRCNFK